MISQGWYLIAFLPGKIAYDIWINVQLLPVQVWPDQAKLNDGQTSQPLRAKKAGLG